MNHYLFFKSSIVYYDETRHSAGINYSSKLSPWLANGSLSVRRLYHSVKLLEEELPKVDRDALREYIY